jgi:Tfp pilus assembly protein FimT
LLIRVASILRFSRSAITRQQPKQALGDTAHDEARGDVAEPMRKQHNAGQD